MHRKILQSQPGGKIDSPSSRYILSISPAVFPAPSPRARMPPVDVPVTKSKHSEIDRPPTYRCSQLLKRAAGKIPLIPPPSIDRIRRGCPSGQCKRWRRLFVERLERGALIIGLPRDVRNYGHRRTIYRSLASPRRQPTIRLSMGLSCQQLTSTDSIHAAYGDKAV